MTTAYVLSGGANLGAVQVGMLLALTEAGITPDLIVGTSVGALNGGWVSSRCDVAGIGTLADTWRSVSRHDVFPARPLTALLGFMGRRRNLVPDSGLRQLLTRNLEFDRLEDAAIPLHVVATDLLSGADVLISRGDAVDAILASAAIPGIFPPVSIDGRDHIDGGHPRQMTGTKSPNGVVHHGVVTVRHGPVRPGCCKSASGRGQTRTPGGQQSWVSRASTTTRSSPMATPRRWSRATGVSTGGARREPTSRRCSVASSARRPVPGRSGVGILDGRPSRL